MRILPRSKAANRAGFSVATLKREEAEGRFPSKIQITVGRVGYLESEVDEYIAERVANRDGSAE